MSEKILIKKIRYPDFSKDKLKTGDLLYESSSGIRKGRIISLCENIEAADAKIFDGRGRYILPSFIDLCSHFCEPGYEYRENIDTGSFAALCGGYSDVLVMPDTFPAIDTTRALTDLSVRIARRSHCNIHKCAALTFSLAGEECCDYDSLAAAGAIAFCDCEEQKLGTRILRKAMQRCAERDYLIILSPGRSSEYLDCPVSEGMAACALGVVGEPASVEEISVAGYIILARETGCRIHIRGISCAGSVAAIAAAKREGLRITASTSPYYFSLCERDVIFIGNSAKIYPPLRKSSDRDAIIQGICDGTIDCIDSAHIPRAAYEKKSKVSDSLFGAIGLQSTFAAAVTYLLLPGHIDIFRLSEILSFAPAKILGLPIPELNSDASSFNIVSLNEEFILTNSYLKSRSLNCPYMGMSLVGMVDKTVIF